MKTSRTLSLKLAAASLASFALLPTTASAAEPVGRAIAARAPIPRPIPKVLTGREQTLPLCEYGAPPSTPYGWPAAQSFLWFLYPADIESHDLAPFMCRHKVGSSSVGCAIGPDQRPVDSPYVMVPTQLPTGEILPYDGEMVWNDGSAAHSVWSVECARSPSGAFDDVVTRSNIEGSTLAMNASFIWSLLATVEGGVVNHIRPGLARGSVNILLDTNKSIIPQDLTLVIQALGDDGWYDLASSTHTVTRQLRTFQVECAVAPGADVRLQVRGTHSRGDHDGSGYDLRDARIFVETCIPDANNPDTCVE